MGTGSGPGAMMDNVLWAQPPNEIRVVQEPVRPNTNPSSYRVRFNLRHGLRSKPNIRYSSGIGKIAENRKCGDFHMIKN